MLITTLNPTDYFGWLADETNRLNLEMSAFQLQAHLRRQWATVSDGEFLHDLRTEEVKYECQSCDYIEWRKRGFGAEEFLRCPKCGKGKGTGFGLVLQWNTRRKPRFTPLHRRTNTMLRRQFGKQLTDTDLNFLRHEWEQRSNARIKAKAEVDDYYGSKKGDVNV